MVCLPLAVITQLCLTNNVWLQRHLADRNTIWRYFASMRLNLAMLFILSMASIFISAPCVEARVQFRSCLSGYAYPYLSFQHVFCYIALCIAACLMLSIFTDGSSFLCVSYVSTHILLLFLGGWHAQFCRLHTDAGSLISPLWFSCNEFYWLKLSFARFVIYCAAFRRTKNFFSFFKGFLSFSPIQSKQNQV